MLPAAYSMLWQLHVIASLTMTMPLHHTQHRFRAAHHTGRNFPRRKILSSTDGCHELDLHVRFKSIVSKTCQPGSPP